MGRQRRKASERNGDEGLADLLQRIWPRLRKIVAAYHVPPEDADDVIGDVLLHFTRKRAHIRAPEPWIAEALRMQCRMYWRTRSRRRTVAVEQEILDALAGGAESDAERAALRRGLERWIATLPYKCQRLLRLRYGLGLDDGEVADETGYQRSSVDKVTRRCVRNLAKKIDAADLGRLRQRDDRTDRPN